MKLETDDNQVVINKCLKEYKVINFLIDSNYQSVSNHISELETQINRYAENGYKLISTPTNKNGYGLLIFEREYAYPKIEDL